MIQQAKIEENVEKGISGYKSSAENRDAIQEIKLDAEKGKFDNHLDTLINYIHYWHATGESINTSIRTKEKMDQLI